jgi:hypothetical protein
MNPREREMARDSVSRHTLHLRAESLLVSDHDPPQKTSDVGHRNCMDGSERVRGR